MVQVHPESKQIQTPGQLQKAPIWIEMNRGKGRRTRHSPVGSHELCKDRHKLRIHGLGIFSVKFKLLAALLRGAVLCQQLVIMPAHTQDVKAVLAC